MNMLDTILVVDDDQSQRRFLGDKLRMAGYEILEGGTGLEAVELVSKHEPSMVLLDMVMPDMDGITALEKIKASQPDLPVVVLTAHASVQAAVEAIKIGAEDFIPKPADGAYILKIIKKNLEQRRVVNDARYLQESLVEHLHMVVGRSAKMAALMKMAKLVAVSRSTILIAGESGTGKQLMAQAIHSHSERAVRPMIQVNCNTLSEQLLESDLFGHEKGAFSGVLRDKQGRVELADNGTLFLDEIAELGPALQAKILQFVEHGEYLRVGGTRTRRVDARLIVATNRNLHKEVDAGRFREDLFYRLNVVQLEMPPLRERMEDLPELVDYLLAKFCRATGKKIRHVASETMEKLRAYSWPGNIRELANVLERGVVLAQSDTMTPDLLPLLSSRNGAIPVGLSLNEAVSRFKADYIKKTLTAHGDNQSSAAVTLDLQRAHLGRLIKELDIR
jgi:DNA-binding NtrC family response regulator